MKEIEIRELFRYIDPMTLEEDPAIALACDGVRTNGLTIGWAEFGILWNKPAATVYIHKDRYSKEIFDKADTYAICFMKKEDRKTLGYFGRVSGRDEDKMVNCGLSVVTDDIAPYFENSRIVVLCRVMGRNDFDPDSVDEGVRSWYKKSGVHTLYHGEIIKVLVSE